MKNKQYDPIYQHVTKYNKQHSDYADGFVFGTIIGMLIAIAMVIIFISMRQW